MDPRHPQQVNEIRDWCRLYQSPIRAGRLRFAQREVLRAIGAHSVKASISFKGGNALRIMHENPRGTVDLDFTAQQSVPDDPEWLRDQFNQALSNDALWREPSLRGIKMRVQSISRNPRRPQATHPTFQLMVGFCLRGDRTYERRFLDFARPVSEVVELQISLNDVVGATSERTVDDHDSETINTCTIDDILGEKLRSLLQQPIRKRNRRQDVFDLANQWRNRREQLDLEQMKIHMVRKCEAREIRARRSAFDNIIRDMACEGYERLREDTRDAFIEFDEAWALVMELVTALDLPE